MATTFTLSHSQLGDVSTDIGTIPRGKTLAVTVLSPSVIEAIRAGTLTCSPSIGTGAAVASLLDNEVVASADAQYDIVDVTASPTQALVNANFATLAVESARLAGEVEKIRAAQEAILARDLATAQQFA